MPGEALEDEERERKEKGGEGSSSILEDAGGYSEDQPLVPPPSVDSPCSPASPLGPGTPTPPPPLSSGYNGRFVHGLYTSWLLLLLLLSQICFKPFKLFVLLHWTLGNSKCRSRNNPGKGEKLRLGINKNMACLLFTYIDNYIDKH